MWILRIWIISKTRIMPPVRGLLLVYRRCVAAADISSLVRFGQMGSDAVIRRKCVS